MPRFPRLPRLVRIPALVVLLLTFAGSGLSSTFSKRPPNLAIPPQPATPTGLVLCGPTVITESTNLIVPNNSVSCNLGGFHADNSYWRAFDLTGAFGITSDFHVCQVTIGVEVASSVGGTQPITVNLYTSSQAFPTGFPGSLTLIGSTATTVADQSGSLATFPVTGTAPAGSQLVVEIFTPNGQLNQNSFFIGSNTDPQTALSYISAADCGFTVPTPTDGIIPGLVMHIVMLVDGTASGPVALAVNPPSFDVGGNGVFELNELATVAPSWANGGLTDLTETGAASNLSWPGGLVPITDAAADYGTVVAGTTQQCTDCYQIEIDGTHTFGQHLDAHMNETISSSFTLPNDTLSKTWTIHIGGSFSDVSTDTAVNSYYPFIETIFHKGVTAGCLLGDTFCPTQNSLRQEMAVFLLKAFLGATYTPPSCTPPGIFSDVPCPGLYTDWIEDLSVRGVTAGCSSDPGPPPTIQFCPDRDILRSEMAVFLLKMSQGSGYTPLACTPPGIFSDVPCPGLYTDWIEDIYTRGITAGCSSDPGPPPTIQFCPDNKVLRQEMAVFLTKTFGLVLYGP